MKLPKLFGLTLVTSCLSVVSSLSFAQPELKAPDATTCLSVFTQTAPSLRENLRFKLQVSDEPERVIDEYVGMMRRTIVGRLITTEQGAKTSRNTLSQKDLETNQQACFSHFSPEKFPQSVAMKLQRQDIMRLDQEIDESMVDLLPALRQIPIATAALYRREIPEHFTDGLLLQRVRQQHGQVDLMFSTSQAVADTYRQSVDTNPVQALICQVMSPHLTPQTIGLVTFSLITPQDSVLGVFEATSCKQEESR
jgi:hypothetical protein